MSVDGKILSNSVAGEAAEYLNRPTVLRNRTCAYCGRELSRTNATKEHVIGRRFVPRGTLNGRWNLILRVCLDCNRKKAELEDDLSAISMQPNAIGFFHASSDGGLRTEAARKGRRSVNRRTGKAVGLSSEPIKLRHNWGSVNIEFSVVGPPQPDPDRVVALALLHVTGLMYWLTYDDVDRIGRFIPGVFCPVNIALRDDWGNAVQLAFMRKVIDWNERIVGLSANGYFGMAIRRRGDSACWSWAFEWNKNLRVIGFFGEEALVREVYGELPAMHYETINTGDGETWRHRREQPLQDTDDQLFT